MIQTFKIGMNERMTIDFKLSQIRLVKNNTNLEFINLNESELSILVYWNERSLTELRKMALIMVKEHKDRVRAIKNIC